MPFTAVTTAKLHNSQRGKTNYIEEEEYKKKKTKQLTKERRNDEEKKRKEKKRKKSKKDTLYIWCSKGNYRIADLGRQRDGKRVLRKPLSCSYIFKMNK